MVAEPDYLMFRKLLKQTETDPALADELDQLIAALAPMAEFRELHRRMMVHVVVALSGSDAAL